MQKRRAHQLAAVLLTFFLLLGNNSKASHAGMMDLTYRHISGNSYEFTLVFYRNCSGSTASAPFSINLRATSLSKSVNASNAATLNQLNTSGPGVPPLQPKNMYNCTSASVCWEEYVYRGVLNLNNLTAIPYARDWVFSYELCCFPGGASLPNNISAGIIRAECGLNNLDFPQGNDAPFWHDRRPVRPGYLNDTVINYPGKAICAGVFNTLDQSVREYEGDIVKYELSPVLLATYVNGFSPAVPMPFITPPGFEIDSITGKIDVVGAASLYTVFVIGIKAIENRLDTVIIGGIPTPVEKEIGYVYRNYMLLLESASSCPDKNIDLKKSKLNLSCGAADFDLETNKKFLCNSADFDASFVEIKEQVNGTLMPIDSVTVNSCFANFVAKSVTIHLTSALPAGKYYLYLKKGSDGNTLVSECGTEIPEFQDTVLITVDSNLVVSLQGDKDTMGMDLGYLKAECGDSILGIKLSDFIQCSSIDMAGSEFVLIDSSLSPPALLNVSSVSTYKCKNNLSDSLVILLSKPFNEGNYELVLKKGSDSNTLLNECGDESPLSSIPIKVPELVLDLGPDLTYCKDSVFYAVLGPSSGFTTYSWNDGQKVPQIVTTGKGTFILEAFNAFGCSVSDTVIVREIDCGKGVGIENQTAQLFKLYPNPAKSVVQLQLVNGASKVAVQLFDQIGKKVLDINRDLKSSKSNLEIDVSAFENGTYLIRLTDEYGNSQLEKLLILR